jgi:hypothetical protein
VQHQSPQKLDRVEGGRLSVTGSEADRVVADLKQSSVADGNAVGIAAEVCEHRNHDGERRGHTYY